MKKHACTYPGCSKAFTRAEHLRRHSLNHETISNSQGYTCQRCMTHFSRADLLSRHLDRHAKKDAEAGGFGKGVLETRKRMRRAEDGSIVLRPPKRPSRHQQKTGPPVGALLSSSGSVSAGSGRSSRSPDVSLHAAQAPVSPPRSASDPVSVSGVSIDDDGTDPDPMLAPMMPGGPFEPYVEPIPGQFDAADGSWGGFDALGDGMMLDTGTPRHLLSFLYFYIFLSAV